MLVYVYYFPLVFLLGHRDGVRAGLFNAEAGPTCFVFHLISPSEHEERDKNRKGKNMSS